MKKKVLIGSPIHQKPAILMHFLESLRRLDINEIDLHYVFVDDNDDEESKLLLEEFSRLENNVNILVSERTDQYVRNEQTHFWSHDLIWKVAGYKDTIIEIAAENDCDYLFLIDSDLVLHPYTLQQLIKSDKDIVSNIFWTKWQPDFPELPQVWMFDEYSQYYKRRDEVITETERIRRHSQFINTLRKPGVYEVGGLGACTLISKRAIKAGVNFSEIKNLSFGGEDRHFCIRAQALGLNLYVDTHYPCFHIYREKDINEVDEFVKKTNIDVSDKESYNILTTVIQGIESLGTTPNRGRSWIKYFTIEYLQHILEEEEKQVFEDISVKAEVCDTIIKEMKEHQNCAIVEFILVNKIISKGKIKYEKLLCNTVLIKRHNEWLIDELRVMENLEVGKKEATRDLAEKKKQISIVYTNLSGSNSAALFKLVPSEIMESCNIELLKQTFDQKYYEKLIMSDVVVITEGNVSLPKNVCKPNQKIIDLWHGFPIKAMGYADKSDFNINRIGKTWRQVDAIASYSELFSKKMNECIKTDINKFFITGSPRNDLLIRNQAKGNLSKLFNTDIKDKKCLLYMPTFRYSFMKQIDEGSKSWENVFGFNEFLNNEFQDFLKNMNIELFVKLHPAEEQIFLNSLNRFNFVNIITNDMLEKNNLDMYEILGGIDLLITDYSSVYFDYLLINKPIIFTPVDLEIYKQRRGLLFEYDEFTPGPKVTSQYELQEEISNSLSNPKYYEKERLAIRDLVHFYKDDKSSERIWEIISEL